MKSKRKWEPRSFRQGTKDASQNFSEKKTEGAAKYVTIANFCFTIKWKHARSLLTLDKRQEQQDLDQQLPGGVGQSGNQHSLHLQWGEMG